MPLGFLGSNRMFRQLLLLVIGVLCAGILVALASSFIFEGHLTIHGSGTYQISVTDRNDHQVVNRSGNDDSSVALSAGSYTVTVQKGAFRQSFFITMGGLQNEEASLSAQSKNSSSPHLLAHQAAFGIIATGGGYTYFNPINHSLESIDSNGNVIGLSPPNANAEANTTGCPTCATTPQAFYPLANSQALVQFNGQLFLLQNQNLSPIQLPNGAGQPGQPLVIGTNADQSSFALGVNSTLYWYDDPTASPRSILDLGKQFDHLAVGGNRVIAYSTRMPLAKQDIKPAYTAYAVDPIIVNTANQTMTSTSVGPISLASVSPDGLYGLIQSINQPKASIYDLGKNSVAFTMNGLSATTPYWISNSQFLYGEGSDIWLMDLAHHTAYTVANLASNLDIGSVSYDSNNNVYYATSYEGEGRGEIWQVPQ